MELTSLELSLLMDEFEKLEDGHVQKVYQRGNELTVEVYIHGEGKERLVIGTDRAFLSKYKRDNPMRPPGFCMELRKHLGRIDSIRQVGFDRILEIESGDTKLICELFGKGNFILTKEEKIIGALRQQEWSDRSLVTGEDYKYPEPADDPREEDIWDLMGEGELVRSLAADLSLGGVYAEEICHRLDIDKNTEIPELDEKQMERIEQEVENVLNADFDPMLYLEDGKPVRASPFPLRQYSHHDFEEKESFSEALDEYYYRRKKKEKEEKKREAFLEKKEGLEKQKEQQERKLQGLQKSSEQNREKAERIYENYRLLSDIKQMVNDAIDEHGWDETRERLKEAETDASEKINSISKQNNYVSVEVEGNSLKVFLDRDLEATASHYYDKAKESEEKMESVEEALEDTRKELEELGEEDVEIEEVMEDKTQKRSKKWFEKYRWFYSSEGYLVVAGRDQQTNDMVVNKHMEKNDLYFHADFDGAPSVVVKEGQEAGEETLKQAAQAAVTFSKTWKAGIGADDVYYVKPEQVTQDPESGEYLSKGAFVIRGDREYMRNISVSASVGPYEIDDTFVPMCGPKEAIEENCEKSIDLRPGHTKKSEIAKEINRDFKDYDLDLDYIIRAMPPGKSEID
jgi:predicted ribosome quality control (RQC) complex YloA/Tae2 family protein